MEIAHVIKEKIIKKINEGLLGAASDSLRFKWAYQRRVTHFYQEKAFLDEDRIKDAAQKFVTEIRTKWARAHPTHQSGFAKEMTVRLKFA